jgi:hypothetical protein
VNYATLFTTIKGYLENDFPATALTNSSGTVADFTSIQQINTFIQQAEQRIYNNVQFPSLRMNVSGNCTQGNKYLACPTDFLAVYSLAVVDGDGLYTYLLNKDVNFIRESYPDPASQGLPEYYALFGPRSNEPNELTFILGPTPDDNYTMELHYFFYPETIVTANTTWLGDNLDSVLLYASLVEAYTFMKGEADMVAQYEKKFQEALAIAKRLGDGMERRDAYRSGQARVPVL